MYCENASEYVIEVAGLSKCYQIYEKPIDRLKQMIMSGRKQYFKDFWALKSVSFQIKKGETLGVIGGNGSGKSTLLQIICGTLSPTAGEIKKNGRIAALLELGAGFNPEFSGLENVYMSAALYGLSNKEIENNLSAIIDFADIGDKLYLPVKTYSSGMYVRLAFAVIAHVNADILVIDEALAVGDAVFTQKCMRFIRNFKKNGTLLFVSHDINAVSTLCNSAIWLKDGELISYGSVDQVVKEYANFCIASQTDASLLCDVSTEKFESGDAELISTSFTPDELVVNGGEEINIQIIIKFNISVCEYIAAFSVKDRLGQVVFGHLYSGGAVNAESRKEVNFNFLMPNLAAGSYSVSISVAEGNENNHRQMVWHHDVKIYKFTPKNIRYGVFELESVAVVEGNL